MLRRVHRPDLRRRAPRLPRLGRRHDLPGRLRPLLRPLRGAEPLPRGDVPEPAQPAVLPRQRHLQRGPLLLHAEPVRDSRATTATPAPRATSATATASAPAPPCCAARRPHAVLHRDVAPATAGRAPTAEPGRDARATTATRAPSTTRATAAGTCSGCSPSVNGVSPLTATLGQPTTFTSRGAACRARSRPSSPVHEPRRDQPRPTTGNVPVHAELSTRPQSGLVKDKPGGTVLYTSPSTCCPARPREQREPTSVSLNQLTTFTVDGPACRAPSRPTSPMREPGRDQPRPTQATFQCTAELLDGAAERPGEGPAGGTVLYTSRSS